MDVARLRSHVSQVDGARCQGDAYLLLAEHRLELLRRRLQALDHAAEREGRRRSERPIEMICGSTDESFHAASVRSTPLLASSFSAPGLTIFSFESSCSRKLSATPPNEVRLELLLQPPRVHRRVVLAVRDEGGPLAGVRRERAAVKVDAAAALEAGPRHTHPAEPTRTSRRVLRT